MTTSSDALVSAPVTPHSRLPWHQETLLVRTSDGEGVAHCTRWERGRPFPEIAERNAEFIVRACNSFDALLDALRSFCGDYESTPTTSDTSLKAAYLHALAVIQKAEGR